VFFLNNLRRREAIFRKNLIPVWVALIVLSGMFLMGASPNGCMPPAAPVAKTGQTTSYAPGDDGDLQMGVASPSPRFTDNVNGTVTDNLTGLIWTQDADCDGTNRTWSEAVDYCNGLAEGTCGLSDGSSAGDWRLPNVRELHTLVDYAYDAPALTTSHPIKKLQFDVHFEDK